MPVASSDIGQFESAPGAMADVQDFNTLLHFQHTIDYAIGVGLVAVKQMAELVTLGRQRASLGLSFQLENSLRESDIPSQRCIRVLGIDLVVQVVEIEISASGQVDEVSHAVLRSP